MKRPQSAFTLIELLLVIVIIAMLIALIGPASQFIFMRVDELTCQRHLAALTQAYMAYVTDNHQFPPLVDQSEFGGSGKYRNWLPPQYNYLVVYNGHFRSGWGPLIWHGMATTDDLICPKDQEQTDDWWALPTTGRNPLVIKREIEEGGAPKEMSRSSYSIRCYLHPWNPATLETGINISVDNGLEFGSGGVQAITACRISTAADVANRHVRGTSVGYLDGTVEFRTDRVLWDDSINKLDGNFQVPTNMQFLMTEVWQKLDER